MNKTKGLVQEFWRGAERERDGGITWWVLLVLLVGYHFWCSSRGCNLTLNVKLLLVGQECRIMRSWFRRRWPRKFWVDAKQGREKKEEKLRDLIERQAFRTAIFFSQSTDDKTQTVMIQAQVFLAWLIGDGKNKRKTKVKKVLFQKGLFWTLKSLESFLVLSIWLSFLCLFVATFLNHPIF